MKYVTRGGIIPQGIPKVYVTGHSSQFMQHFAHIKEDILKFSNCAVFYDPDPEHPEDIDPKDPKGVEKFKSLLKSMQLVVLVVTRRFVEEDTFAFSEVFQFANEETIPVLPILEENGIEAAFNEKCGNIQMLNPYSEDPTEISYEDKLKKRLDAVLIGDEMAEKIRAAFDAYVFLSYRKKDREQAQKLMQLIHSNDFCRDVAIWYDEFLVPGEDFNQAIAAAMKKSDLFALTVTPHLLEEGNYVMTTEYPEAAKANMSILPVELEETDSEKLQEKYSEIPTILRADDANRLKRALKQILGLDDTVRNNDPQHMFFIGLAYLSGIDVEVNRKRAVELITAAAKQDLPEAMDKLVSMYHEGEGVERDYPTAIEWQKRLVELREKQYRQSKNVDNAWKWIYDFNLLAEYTEEIGHYEEALEIYKNKLTALDDISQLHYKMILNQFILAPEDMQEYVMTWINIGKIYGVLGNLQEAKTWCKKAIDFTEKLAVQSDNAVIQHDYAHSCYAYGGICQQQGNLSAAKEYYEKAIVIFEKLAAQSNSVDPLRCLGSSYNNLGNICQEQDNLADAKKWYKKALSIAEKIAAQSDSAEIQGDIGVLYGKLGDICEKQGDHAEAKEWYEKALAIRERLAAQSDSVEAQRDLSVSYDKLGGICEAQHDLAGAKEWYEKGLVIDEKIAAQSDSVQAQKDLAWSYNKLRSIYNKFGDSCLAQDDPAGANKCLEKALVIFNELKSKGNL